jgi:putative spermidine/putrescine transport system substrate-binding protein/spermidine/putrescine transport system substrate-binding protein
MKKIAVLLIIVGLFANCGKEKVSDKTVDLDALKGSTLRILACEGYVDDSFAKGFEDKYGVTVKASYFGSSEELVSKLKSVGATYDIISSSYDVAGYLISSNLVEPIATDQITAWDSLSPILKGVKGVQKGKEVYGMPFTWGPNYLVYNADVIKETPTSWSIFNDPKYKGKISLYDNISSIYLEGHLMGYDKEDQSVLYNMNEAQLLACKTKLVEMRPQVHKFWTLAGELDNLFKNKEIVAAVGWPVTPASLNKQGMNIKAVVPKEGATGWVNCLMIVKGTKNKQLAQLWLNYVSQAKVMAEVAAFTQYYVANPSANVFLSVETKKLMDVTNMNSMLETLNFSQPVKDRKRYSEIWSEVKNR